MANRLESIWRGVRTAAVVVVISCLIWYAADLNVSMTEEFKISVRLESDDEDVYVSLAEPPFVRELKVVLKGRRVNLQEFGREHDSGVLTVQLDQPKQIFPEPQELLSDDDVLMKIPLIRQSRLTVDSVAPPTLLVRIDKYETLEDRPIEVVGADAEPSRKTVSVTLPGFLANRMRDRPVKTKNAKEIIQEKGATDGDTFRVDVPLALPDNLENQVPDSCVKFIPEAHITITGLIEALLETKRVAVQITWSIPDSVQKEYSVVAENNRFRVDVDVTGPKDEIERLRREDILGLVEVYATDAEDYDPVRVIVRPIRFLHPGYPHCEVDAGPAQELRFRLQRRTDQALGTPTG